MLQSLLIRRAMKIHNGWLIAHGFGIAVHQKDLHQTKTRLDRAINDWLVELFSAVKRPSGLTAEYCARGTYALVLGLLPAAFFDEQLSVSQTQCILRDAMRRWAGFDEL